MSEIKQKSLSGGLALLKKSWQLFVQHWLEFIVLGFIIVLPGLLFDYFFGATFNQFFSGNYDLVKASPLVAVGVVLMFIVTSLISLFGLLCVLYAVIGAFDTLLGILMTAAKRFGAFIGLQVFQGMFFVLISFGIYYLFVFLGLLLGAQQEMIAFSIPFIFFPTIVFAVYFSLSSYTFVVEGLGPIASMKKSLALVRGWWWTVWSKLLVFAVVFFLASLIFSGILYLIPGGVYITNLASVVIAPWFLLYLHLVYQELTVVKSEGLMRGNMPLLQKLLFLFLSVFLVALAMIVALSQSFLFNKDYIVAEALFYQTQESFPEVTDKELYIRGFLLGDSQASDDSYDDNAENVEIIGFVDNESFLSGYQTGFLFSCQELGRSSERCFQLLQQRMDFIAAEINSLIDPSLLENSTTTSSDN